MMWGVKVSLLTSAGLIGLLLYFSSALTKEGAFFSQEQSIAGDPCRVIVAGILSEMPSQSQSLISLKYSFNSALEEQSLYAQQNIYSITVEGLNPNGQWFINFLNYDDRGLNYEEQVILENINCNSVITFDFSRDE